jgi:cell division protein FtsL
MRQTTILTLILAAVMSVALFYLKYEVTNLEKELGALNRKIVVKQKNTHVLKAEWSHLNNLTRIKDLASRYLEMTPTESHQIKSVEEMVVDIKIKKNPTQDFSVSKILLGIKKKVSD